MKFGRDGYPPSPYLFTGRRADYLDDGSLKIQYNRNRSYDYTTGRWLQRDPLDYVLSPNLYLYATCNPVMRIDPFGLSDNQYMCIDCGIPDPYDHVEPPIIPPKPKPKPIPKPPPPPKPKYPVCKNVDYWIDIKNWPSGMMSEIASKCRCKGDVICWTDEDKGVYKYIFKSTWTKGKLWGIPKWGCHQIVGHSYFDKISTCGVIKWVKIEGLLFSSKNRCIYTVDILSKLAHVYKNCLDEQWNFFISKEMCESEG